MTFLGGVRHGLTLGSPVAVMVGNTGWPKWEQVMAAGPVDPEVLGDLARNAPLTRPRPSHADLAGMQKYGFDEARPVLERASARETAARVALGAIARSYLKETVGIEIVSHIVELADAKAPYGSTGAWTPGSPPPSWASRPSRASRSATASGWRGCLGPRRMTRSSPPRPASGAPPAAPAAPRANHHR